jgi:hypothetical protein
VIASCDQVVNGHIHVGIANKERLPMEALLQDLETELLDTDAWKEYHLVMNPPEIACCMVGAEDEEEEESTAGSSVHALPAQRCTRPQELRRVVKQIQPPLPAEEEATLVRCLHKYRTMFALDGEPLGRTGWVKHAIRLACEVPIKQAPRRIPMH